MAQEIDSIRMSIEETKASLTSDLIFLEDKLKSRVQAAKQSVESTLDEVRSEAQKFTPSYQIQKHPLLVAGGAIAAGVVLGKWLNDRRPAPPNFGSGAGPSSVPVRSNAAAIVSLFSKEIDTVKGIAASSILRWVGDKAKEVLPEFEKDIAQVVDGMVEKIHTPTTPA